MTPVVLKRPRAERDLLNYYTHIGEHNPDAAERFLDAAQDAFLHLARMPGMGQPWHSASPRLAGVRSWTIPRFTNYRIFYRPIVNGVEILHVFHARRDIQSLLEVEEEPGGTQ